MKFNIQSEGSINICIILSVYLSIHHVQQNIQIINGKIDQQIQFKTYAGVSLYLTSFLQNELVMYVSINIQLINFQNYFGILSWLCQGKS